MSDSTDKKKPPTGYKQTDLGLLPNCWEVLLLGDLFVFNNGLNKSKRFFGTGTPIANYMDVIERPGFRTDDLSGRVKLSDKEIKNFKVRLGNVFFTRTSETVDTVDEVGVASVMLDEPCDTVLSGFLLQARPRDGHRSNRYKQYCFAPRVIRTQSVLNATYPTRALTNGRSLSAVKIAVPPKLEQRAISTALSDVDKLLNAMDKLIAKKRSIKQAATQQLLTGQTRLPGFSGKWVKMRLGDLGIFSKGRGIKRDDLRETGVPCVRYGELYTRYKNYVFTPVSRIPQHIADTALPIRKGDLLFAGSGETADEIGICVAFVGDEPAYAGGDIIVLRAPGLDAVYLAHHLNAPVVASQKARMAQGDAIVHIRGDHLAEIELSLPPLPEQRAIAKALSDVDKLLNAMDKLIAKKRSIKQAAMQQLLTGQTRLPRFSGKWETKKIGDFTICAAGGTPSTLVKEYWGGTLRWMNSGELNSKRVHDVEGRITGRGLRESSTRIIPPQCVLVGLAGQGKTRGTVAINFVELCTNQSIAAIFPNECFVPEYLFYNLDARYQELRGMSTGEGGRGGLNLQIIRSISLPFPEIDEQRAIATILSDIDSEIAALKQRRDKIRAIKQGMMQALLTGRVRLVKPQSASEPEAKPVAADRESVRV